MTFFQLGFHFKLSFVPIILYSRWYLTCPSHLQLLDLIFWTMFASWYTSFSAWFFLRRQLSVIPSLTRPHSTRRIFLSKQLFSFILLRYCLAFTSMFQYQSEDRFIDFKFGSVDYHFILEDSRKSKTHRFVVWIRPFTSRLSCCWCVWSKATLIFANGIFGVWCQSISW